MKLAPTFSLSLAVLAGTLRAAAAVASATPPAAPAAPVAVTLRRSAAGLDMEAAGLPQGATALLVFYDPEHATAVAAGENSGRRLKEYRVVRAAREIAMSEGRAAAPDAPAGQGAALLVRDRAWRIIGAADLPPAPKVTG